ncbi:MAG: GNAT family N-acetyltransferase [Myxococcales bacterium]|nr:GNAT family N-acetyltransferase [Myxococcales bacterium]
MHVRVVRPDLVRPEELDSYLARGWFRIGQAMMTCRVVLFDGELRPSIWTRVPVDGGYRPGKNARKLLSRAERRFRIEIGPMTLDDEREALYQRYRANARGERSPTLVDFLYGDADRNVFDTREISLWEGDRLVAFSWFDQGAIAVQSLIGVYDPEHGGASLGLTTMLLEARHAADQGLSFHYPGYVLPGDPAMDYKLRLGGVEVFDPWQRRWRPLEQLADVPLPTERLELGLDRARAALSMLGVPSEIRKYPWFEAPAWQPDLTACVGEPLVLECFPERAGATFLAVTHDLDRGLWVLQRCLRARAVTRGRADVDTPIELWLVAERLSAHTSLDELAQEVRRRGSDRMGLRAVTGPKG